MYIQSSCVYVFICIYIYMCDELGYPHALRNLHVYASNANLSTPDKPSLQLGHVTIILTPITAPEQWHPGLGTRSGGNL